MLQMLLKPRSTNIGASESAELTHPGFENESSEYVIKHSKDELEILVPRIFSSSSKYTAIFISPSSPSISICVSTFTALTPSSSGKRSLSEENFCDGFSSILATISWWTKQSSTGADELYRTSSAGLVSSPEIATLLFVTVSLSSICHAIWFSSIQTSLSKEPKKATVSFEYDLALFSDA